jgi:alkanesulfonate monooxygenase SsuD/methylene tetrahydromethanopterin reductase-like flavin-dependent oxidoreductase (luciferase family)
MRFVRELAGERSDDIQWHLLVQMVVPTTDRRATAEDIISRFGTEMTADEALEMPYLLIGTPEQMAEQLVAGRERWGFSYVTVHEPYREAFEPVVQRLRS